jgi:hypothetical protein
MDEMEPWSTVELDALEHALRLGVSIEVIADFVGRHVDEVRRAAAERGLGRVHLSEEAFD